MWGCFPGAWLDRLVTVVKRTPEPIVTRYGSMWARNLPNIKAIEREALGVYVLCDGSMPVYIGKGRLRSRLKKHRTSRSKGQTWDHFTWFQIEDARNRSEVEALLVRMLPHYLRVLNRARPKFHEGTDRLAQDKNHEVAEYIKRPGLAPRRPARRRRRTHR